MLGWLGTEEWLDSELGVYPVQVALQVRGAYSLSFGFVCWVGREVMLQATKANGKRAIVVSTAKRPSCTCTPPHTPRHPPNHPLALLFPLRWPFPSWTAALSPLCLRAATPTPARATPCPTASSRCAGAGLLLSCCACCAAGLHLRCRVSATQRHPAPISLNPSQFRSPPAPAAVPSTGPTWLARRRRTRSWPSPSSPSPPTRATWAPPPTST